MSIATEIARLQQAKADLKASINAKGGTITNETIDEYASKVSALPSPKEEETKTVTPNFSSGNVVVTPTSGKVMTQVTINKDANLIADNIKSGVTIFGITGTYEGEPSGFEVAVTFGNLGYWSPCTVYVYDGNNTSGTLLDTVIDPPSGPKTYNVASGNLYIYANENVESFNYWVTNPSTSGGVTVINKNGNYDLYFILCSVTADGSLNTGNYSCFVKGTKITLADGTTKNVEDITYDDKLLTWNFDDGKQDNADIFWIAKESKALLYWEVTFSDNTKLGLVGAKNKSHRLFNLEQGKFAYPQDFNEGEHTIKEDGSLVTITSCVKLQKEVTYYNLATSKRLNNYANGILTGCRFTNIYPIQDMKYVKDDRPLIAREEYKEIPDKYFDGLRLAEQPLDTQNGDVNYFNTTKEHVIHNYIEHEKNWQGAKDYKQWEFKKGIKEN
jgi:hypothetical protein